MALGSDVGSVGVEIHPAQQHPPAPKRAWLAPSSSNSWICCGGLPDRYHAALGAKLLWRETALIELADDKAIAAAQNALADLGDAASVICAEKGSLLNVNRAPLEG
jgi:hypothetical protein